MSTPRCSIDLNCCVSENGSLTAVCVDHRESRHTPMSITTLTGTISRSLARSISISLDRTEYEAREEVRDPEHEQHLRQHHGHLLLHHVHGVAGIHHLLHGTRRLDVLVQQAAFLVGQQRSTRHERRARQQRAIGSKNLRLGEYLSASHPSRQPRMHVHTRSGAREPRTAHGARQGRGAWARTADATDASAVVAPRTSRPPRAPAPSRGYDCRVPVAPPSDVVTVLYVVYWARSLSLSPS